ncbi:MAG: hypothetical protein ACRDRU_25075 [Pseudonocardiaceae bacterium]
MSGPPRWGMSSLDWRSLCRACGAILADGVELELTSDPTVGHHGQRIAGDGEIVIGFADATGPR